MSRKVCVVGGTGSFGGWMARFLEDVGEWSVTRIGRTDRDQWPLHIQSADIVMIAVPISQTQDVIKEVIPHLAPGALLCDVTSVKVMPMKEMLAAPEECGVLGLHPLFGPLVNRIQGQRVVVTRGRDNEHADALCALFENAGARLISMTPDEHDRKMALVQTMTHFVNMIYLETMSRRGEHIDDVSTPPSRIQNVLGGRIVSGSGELYADIQMMNPYSREVLTEALSVAREWVGYVERGDREAFAEKYARLARELDDFIPVAQSATTRIAALIDEQPVETHKGTPLGSVEHTRIITLGPEGTFSHEAAQQVFGVDADIVFKPTITSVFEEVFEHDDVVGIVPIENSTQGIVQETLDAILKYPVQTFGSYTHPIHLYLMGRTDTLASVERVKSHPQPLHQSRNWLQAHLPDALLETESSSIKAILSADDPETAFIAGKSAADRHNLTILAEHIEDKKNNATEFYVIAKEPESALRTQFKAHKTALALLIYDRPGILRDILDAFASKGINLTKLHSKLSDIPGNDYYFFIEVDARPDDHRMREALKEVEKLCYITRIVGAV